MTLLGDCSTGNIHICIAAEAVIDQKSSKENRRLDAAPAEPGEAPINIKIDRTRIVKFVKAPVSDIKRQCAKVRTGK